MLRALLGFDSRGLRLAFFTFFTRGALGKSTFLGDFVLELLDRAPYRPSSEGALSLAKYRW